MSEILLRSRRAVFAIHIKKVDVLIGGIFGIDIFHLNSVVIVKS
jgi:hypothetical protein